MRFLLCLALPYSILAASITLVPNRCDHDQDQSDTYVFTIKGYGHQYFEYTDGILTLVTCPDGYKFEFIDGEGYCLGSECTDRAGVDCDDGLMEANDDNNRGYFTCKHGTWFNGVCALGEIYDSSTESCEAASWILFPDSFDLEQDGVRVLQINGFSRLHYVYINGSPISVSCPDDFTLEFSNGKGYCLGAECTDLPEESCVDGLKANPKDNRGYFKCVNGTWFYGMCALGEFYNNNTELCEATVAGPIPDQCDHEQEGEVFTLKGFSQLYFRCMAGSLTLMSCPDGFDFVYNNDKGYCIAKHHYPSEEPCDDGQIVASADDSQKFIQCNNGNWFECFCTVDHFYDNRSGSCKPKTEEPCTDGLRKSIAEEDNRGYLECENGSWVEKFCDDGEIYDRSSSSCKPKPEEPCTDELRKSIAEEDNRGYLECENGSWVEKFCDDGEIYDRSSSSCKPKPEEPCTDGLRKSIAEEDNRGYLECENGSWVEKFCDDGDIYDSISASCTSKPEEPCTDGLRKAIAEEDNRGYLECENGFWVEELCDLGYIYDIRSTLCTTKPKLCIDGQKKAVAEGSRGFKICVNGSWIDELCASGEIYDCLSTSCKELPAVEATAPLPQPASCEPPEDCPHDAYFPDNCNCRKFYQCDHGGAVHKDCGPGTAFNPKIGVCDWPYKVKLCKDLGQH